MLDKKELSLTLDDFRTIFHLPQPNDNNYNSFMPPLSFLDMVPFYKQQLGFTIELKTSSSFKTTGLLKPWQTLCKIFSKCLTTRVTGWDQLPLQIIQMMYCFVNNIHVDYAELLWEGIYYSLHHPTSLIPYPRFTKIIISHYMTSFPEISRRAHGMYHNLQDDDIMKNILNSGRHKDKVGMQILDWMIIKEMKHTEHYRMYAEVFGLDVPLTQRSTRLTPPALVPTVDKADEMILQDTLQIEKMVEGSENVIDDSLHPRNDEPKILGTRLEPRSDKESPEVNTNDEEVEITNVVIPVNVNEEEDEITDEVYELKRREKGKIELMVADTQKTPSSRSPNTKLSKTNRLLSLFKAKPTWFKRYKNFFQELQGRYTYLFGHLKERFLSRKSFDTLADHLQEVMVESLPTMVDTHIKEQVKKQVPEQVRDQVPVYVVEGLIMERKKTKEEMERMILQQQDIAIWLALQMKFENLQVPQTTCRPSVVRQRIRRSSDDANLEGRMWQSGRSNQEQVDDYDFWTDSYASYDDEIPMKQVSQDIIEEVSLTIDEAKLKKMADEMLRQRCTSGDEHQYHIDQMKNFLKSDIVWESRKEILVSPNHAKDPTSSSSWPEKIVLSLHKFPAIIFNDDDIEERTSRWVNKCVKKFNPYARYGVEHWKNPHAKIFYIKKQKELGKPKEEVYSNSKIIQVIKTYWELGHEHKFIIDIVARRANECIVSITEPDYKNLNKNDIEDMYLLIMNGKVPDYAKTGLLWSLSLFIKSSVIWERVHDFQLIIKSYQQKVNLTAPTISFPGVEKHKMFSIIYEPVHVIIYKNSKKEKRVMRHS
ncbi:hypothetical protein Tco_0967030 [Tanacetum coccineum]